MSSIIMNSSSNIHGTSQSRTNMEFCPARKGNDSLFGEEE